jgi:hypothetical protein
MKFLFQKCQSLNNADFELSVTFLVLIKQILCREHLIVNLIILGPLPLDLYYFFASILEFLLILLLDSGLSVDKETDINKTSLMGWCIALKDAWLEQGYRHRYLTECELQ